MALSKLNQAVERLANIERKLDQAIDAASTLGYCGGNQPFGHITYAQHAEDLIVANILTLIGIETPSYIDIGAHHPLRDSNTALFYRNGSRGINVEANPDLINEFQRRRPDDITLNVGVAPQPGTIDFYRIDRYSGRNTFDRNTAEQFVQAHRQFTIQDVIRVETVTLQHIIDRHCGAIYPDFMSIDIEGLDYDVLKSTDFSQSRPKVLCVETTSGDNRSEDHRLAELLTERGFYVQMRTLSNLICVDQSFRNQLWAN